MPEILVFLFLVACCAAGRALFDWSKRQEDE